MKMYLPLVLLIASSQLVHAQPSDLHPIYRASSVEVAANPVSGNLRFLSPPPEAGEQSTKLRYDQTTSRFTFDRRMEDQAAGRHKCRIAIPHDAA
jgi:hypothetical protein